MRTYQIIFKNGLTRNIEADGYIKTGLKIVFFGQRLATLSFRRETVMTVEEVRDLDEYDQEISAESVIQLPFHQFVPEERCLSWE